MGAHCEVAVDPECYDSSLCSSEPVCKPNLVYSNPCEIGVPLADNGTSELLYCHQGKRIELLWYITPILTIPSFNCSPS